METKYQVGKNGYQCIGPCYPKDTYIIHPNTMHVITSKDDSFCPVSLWDVNGVEQQNAIDYCYKPIPHSEIKNQDISMDIVNPKIIFTCDYFLVVYNNIFSYDDFIVWLNNSKTEPLLTRKRIINCVLNVYGENIIIIDKQLVEFFSELIKKYWINDIYKNINKYISVKDNVIDFTEPSKNNLTINDKKIERVNYIINNLLNEQDISKFLIKYISANKEKWKSINNHIEQMEHDIIIYLINKIKTTLK